MAVATAAGVCRSCARRAWLLGQLACALERIACDPARLWPALALEDEQLIDALGGERRGPLRDAWLHWSPGSRPPSQGQLVCRHHCLFPPRLGGDPLAPPVILLRGPVDDVCQLGDDAVVAVVGTPTPSAYGRRCARSLARELAGSGVAVACSEDDLGACARAGARDAGGQAIVVGRRDCHIAEPTLNRASRAWSRLLTQRTLTLLARLTLVVEAGEHGPELECVELARSRGTPFGAVPGPIDSPLSAGTNALLDEGAVVVRGAQDVLDTLSGVRRPRPPRRRRGRRPTRRAAPQTRGGTGRTPTSEPHTPQDAGRTPTPEQACPPPPPLDQRLAGVLARVGRGEDTLAKLCAGGRDCGDVALALTELELLGVLRREPDDRYCASAEYLR